MVTTRNDGELEARVLRLVGPVLGAAGVAGSLVRCRVVANGFDLDVHLSVPGRVEPAVRRALGVRVLDAVAASGRRFGQVEVYVDVGAPRPETKEQRMGEILSHPVRDVMTQPPVSVAETDTLREVAHRLWAAEVGVAIVGRDDRPVGVVSERDVVAALAAGADPDALTAAQAMTAEVLTATGTDRVLTAAIDMIDRGFRHLPVFDDAGRCIGVVSMRDLLRPMLLDALEPAERAG